ncbi:hypothetical protein LAZ67_2005072 [Cordylochernes scorpioides]|uniref:Uncharacterized protein n=1 Tax=Cordylochernes scorpioides TaxID=51811 RepID=A0ABY6K5Q1_9ARAC|nr:hypothetical protein LAZ67_2005072 [Cordylochernes scorpioides]
METSEALHWTRQQQQQQYSIHTQDRGHCDCCDRDAWRHLRLFIGHNNNNTVYTPKIEDIVTAVIEISLDTTTTIQCMETSEALHCTRQQQQYSIHTQDGGHCCCCDRDAWIYLRLFIGHGQQQQYSIHTQDRGHCCDRDVWRHLKLFIGHDNNNTVYTPKIVDIATAVIEMYGDIRGSS